MLYGILVVSTKKDQQTQNTTQSGFFLRKANREILNGGHFATLVRLMEAAISLNWLHSLVLQFTKRP